MKTLTNLALIALTAFCCSLTASAQGCLTGTLADSAFVTNLNLTAGNFEDWAIWGVGRDTSLSPYTRKINGMEISDLTALNNGWPLRGHGQFFANHTFDFTDGDPIPDGTAVFGGLQPNNPTEDGLGLGFEFTVAASTVAKQVVVYTAHHNGAMSFTASLSDGSAADVSFVAGELGSNIPAIFTLDYRTESDDELLTIKVEIVSNAGTSVNPQLYGVTVRNIEAEISGPEEVCLNEPATYTIEDYDPERSYRVVVDQGPGNASTVVTDFPDFEVTWSAGTTARVCVEKGECGLAADCVDVTVRPLVGIAFDGDTVICNDDVFVYNLEPPLTDGETWDITISNGTLEGQAAGTVSVRWDRAAAVGTGELCVLRTGGGCAAGEVCLDVAFADFFAPTIVATTESGEPVTGSIAGGTRVVLTATGLPDSFNGTVGWTGNYDIVASDDVSITVLTPASGDDLNYTVTVTAEDGGCAATAAINLRLDEPVYKIPELITPNGDGTNDLFRVYSSGSLTDYSLRIFNRWGQPVFESADPGQAWDGTKDGTPQTTDLYLYVTRFRLNGVAVEEDGAFHLVR